jgi:drug/metabolite transporter (DMT)-like permease
MIEAWIPITVGAAFFQNLRSAIQKHLKGRLSNSGAAYARFFYALPLAAAYVLSLNRFAGFEYPDIHATFLLYCFLGGISQILFTVFLLWMFSFRSFAVGTTFSKLEVVMVAILGAIILGDDLGPFAVAAIFISALGVFALTAGQSGISFRSLVAGLVSKPTMIGLVCAAWLGGSVVFFRGASLSLEYDNFIMSAGFTLAVSLLIQTVVMGAYLVIREPGELSRVLREWRWASLVGITGVLASIGWFSAFTLVNASFVRAVGQIELIFTYAATVFVFREKIRALESIGIALIGAGIIMIVLLD